MNLLDNTMAMLRNRPPALSLPAIAAAANVPREWLAKLSKGAIKEPGVQKVQRLHDFLLAQTSRNEAQASKRMSKPANQAVTNEGTTNGQTEKQ